MVQTVLLAIIVLLTLRSIADYGGHLLMRKTGNQIAMQFYDTLFNKILNLPASHYQDLDINFVTDVSSVYINQISQSVAQIAITAVRDILILIGLLLCVAWFDRDWAMLLVLLTPFVFIMMQIIQDQQNTHLHSSEQTLSHQIRRIFNHFKQIKLFGGQQQEYARLNKITQTIQDKTLQRANFKAFITIVCQHIILLIVIAVSYLVSQQVLNNTFAFDQAGAFITAILLMFVPIKRLTIVPQKIQEIQNPLEQLFSLLDQSVVSDQHHGDKTLSKTDGELVFKQISYFSRTQRETILQSVDLTIKAGETVALVCENKQTSTQLIDLILGFSPPATGKILIDGHLFSEIKQADLLAHFSVISATPIFLDDKVAGNIAYGLTQCANEVSITTAAQTAQASSFIREMPEGLQTRINEKEINLTPKQWQQIAIARTLLKNPSILILDNIWPESSQQSLRAALSNTMRNRTTIILMLSFPTTRENIDRVLLLEKGVLTEK